MSSFGKRVDIPGGRRRVGRSEVAIPGTAMALDGSKPVLVEDFGANGARLIGRDLPVPGQEVVLRTMQHAVLGRIVWADRDRRGIIFESPQSELD
jgi:hypothetical protein